MSSLEDIQLVTATGRDALAGLTDDESILAVVPGLQGELAQLSVGLRQLPGLPPETDPAIQDLEAYVSELDVWVQRMRDIVLGKDVAP